MFCPAGGPCGFFAFASKMSDERLASSSRLPAAERAAVADEDEVHDALRCNQVRFAHAVNSAALLRAALADPAVNFIECDVICDRTVTVTKASTSTASSTPHAAAASEHVGDAFEADSEGDDSDTADAEDGHGAGAGAGAAGGDADAATAAAAGRVKRSRRDAWPQPVMGHDPGSPWDLSFAALVDALIGSGKGLKVDIKEWAAVPGVLAILRRKTRRHEGSGGRAWPSLHVQAGPHFFHRPALMINADVLTGTEAHAGGGCRFNPEGVPLPREAQMAAARSFIEAVGAALPSAILSIGLSTAAAAVDPVTGAPLPVPHTYSSAALEDMAALTHEYAACGVAFTYPVRAPYLRHCWLLFKALLLDTAPASSITLWSHTVATEEEMRFFHAALDQERTMYDLPVHPPSEGRETAGSSSRGLSSVTVTIAVGAAIGAVLSVLALRFFHGRLR